MERIISRYTTYCKAVKTLEKPIKKAAEITGDEVLQELIRDALIKKFEYCYEALWQLGKQLLEDKYKITVMGPANIFRELWRLKVITTSQLDAALNMSRDRNQTSHTYKEPVAKEIAQHIILYKTILEELIPLFKKEIET